MVYMLIGCGQDAAETVTADTAARAFEADECEVCGMILREQPAPRGQIVHRDGTRFYFCAIADMLAYLDVPSRHGAVVATYAEVMPADATAEDIDVSQRPWRLVEDVTFVFGGLERPVMGEPMLTFGSAAEGTAAAERLGARAVSWSELPDALEIVGDPTHFHTN